MKKEQMDLLDRATEEKILRAVEQDLPELLELAQGMLRIKSVNPEHEEGKKPEMADGETKVNRFLQPFLQSAGMETDLFATTPAQRHNLVGTLKGSGGGPSLLFNGHIDVVGVGELSHWTVDPWGAEIRDGVLYGRGASDMKCGVACAAAAVRALQKAGIRLRGDVILESVVGEENMNTAEGTGGCIARGYRADAGICVEPSGYPQRLAIMPAAPGALTGRLSVEGRATHSCMRDEIVRAGGQGSRVAVSAFDKAVFVYEGLRRLEEEWGQSKSHPVFSRPGHFTLNPASIVTGPDAYSIPTSASMVYSAWYPPQQTSDEIKEELGAYIHALCSTDSWLRQHEPQFTWEIDWPPYNVPSDAPICRTLDAAYRVALAEAPHYDGFSAVNDAAFLNRAGIPTVTFGPGSLLYAHAADEHVDVSDLLDAAKVYALTIAAWCGIEEQA